jgi:hypothetical protein
MQLSTDFSRRYGVEAESKAGLCEELLDKLQVWLEGDDSYPEMVLGYGLCVFAFIFLVLQVIRSIIYF